MFCKEESQFFKKIRSPQISFFFPFFSFSFTRCQHSHYLPALSQRCYCHCALLDKPLPISLTASRIVAHACSFAFACSTQLLPKHLLASSMRRMVPIWHHNSAKGWQPPFSLATNFWQLFNYIPKVFDPLNPFSGCIWFISKLIFL